MNWFLFVYPLPKSTQEYLPEFPLLCAPPPPHPPTPCPFLPWLIALQDVVYVALYSQSCSRAAFMFTVAHCIPFITSPIHVVPFLWNPVLFFLTALTSSDIVCVHSCFCLLCVSSPLPIPPSNLYKCKDFRYSQLYPQLRICPH